MAFSAAASTLGFLGGKFISRIDEVGHSATHFLQKVHFEASIYARLFSILIASNSQTLKHLLQAMQATLQALLAGPPLSQFEHAT